MTLQIGDVIIYIDPVKKEHNALVTAIHGDAEAKSSINLILISDDENKGDEYGRQLERQTSIVHRDNQSAGANCWYIA